MGFGGKRRKSKSASRWTHAPHHPRARSRFVAFNAEMKALDEAAERASRSIAQFAYAAEVVRRTYELLSRVMLSGAEMGEDWTIRFRPFAPVFTTRIGVKP